MEDIFRIGILAGMGPRSTAPFLEAVLDECERQYGAKFDEDFPHILVYSLPTPFHPKKPLDQDRMRKALKIGIETLSRGDVQIIAIPCNVVHLYYDQMQAMTDIPILHIVKETMEAMDNTPSKVGLLATRATVESGLYQSHFAQKEKTLYWDESFQNHVDELIYKVKRQGVSDEVFTLWKSIENLLIENHVREIVCACTDLFFCRQNSSLRFYDSAQILASSLVKEYIKGKQRLK